MLMREEYSRCLVEPSILCNLQEFQELIQACTPRSVPRDEVLKLFRQVRRHRLPSMSLVLTKAGVC